MKSRLFSRLFVFLSSFCRTHYFNEGLKLELDRVRLVFLSSIKLKKDNMSDEEGFCKNFKTIMIPSSFKYDIKKSL